MIKILKKSIREYKKDSILSIVLVFFEVIMECILPLVMSKLIDEMNGGELNKIWMFAGILIGLALLSLTFGILAGIFCARASAGFAKNLRKDLFDNVSDFSFANIDKFSSSSLVTRMTTDVTNVQMAYMMIIRTAIRSPFMLIFSITMSFVMAPSLAWLFVIIMPVLFGVLMLIIMLAMVRFKKALHKYDDLNNSIQENVSGIRVVKSYVREEYEKEKFGHSAGEVKKEFTKAEKIIAWNQPAMQIAIYLVTLLVIFLGARIICNNSSFNGETFVFNKLSVGHLSSLITYGMQSLMALMMFSMVIVMITLAIESAKRISEVLNEKSSLTNPDNPIYDIKDGSIEFDDVCFKYNKDAKKFALSNVNLKIKEGETIGILGSTGSSKTTLVNLISRLYDATVGSVKVGGIDVKKYDLTSLRNQVSVVLQKNLLFSGTIKDNLRWGNKDASDEEMIHACKIACADEFIQKFKDKYDTYIEQGGTNVSGGQKQRLCIARAILKKPKVLILDDSTSAVDTKTDSLIRRAMKEEIPNTTKIIIAQRISSIEDCDQIIIMDKGVVNQVGTHKELLETNEIYKEVFYSQNKAGDNNANA